MSSPLSEKDVSEKRSKKKSMIIFIYSLIKIFPPKFSKLNFPNAQQKTVVVSSVIIQRLSFFHLLFKKISPTKDAIANRIDVIVNVVFFIS